MEDARVLVVDDSAAMRALFSDLLDQTRGISVVGTANGAAEARERIAELRPNVLTLDVEMPGMSGIEFLEEIMTTRPIPVVMLSSLTQAGTETSLKAFELGAVECFPKPLKASPEEFAKTVGKLGKIVLAAANSNVKDRVAKPKPKASGAPFSWNGRIVAMSASMGGIDALSEIFAHYPKNCPPTVVVLQSEPALVETFIAKLDRDLEISVKAVADGAALTPGTVHIAYDLSKHVLFEAGEPPRLRLVQRDPIEGARPSATLLFGTIARAQAPAVGAVLTGMGRDGGRGLKLMKDAGGLTYVQNPDSATVAQAPAEALALGASDQKLDLDPLAQAILASCSQG